MAAATATGAETDAAERRRLARQWRVVVGLLLTFGGLFLVVGVLPVAADPLVRELPLVGAGLLTLWVGGILMGFAMGRRVPPQGG